MKHLKVAVRKLWTCEYGAGERIMAGNRPFTAGQGDIEQKFRERDESNGQL